MGSMIKLVLGNFPITCLVLAWIFSLFPKRGKTYGERLTRYLLLLPAGLAGLWGFYYHAFEPNMAAQYIGWANSPFQYEVAMANLGMGIAGVVGFWRSKDFALAVTLFISCFLWGAAINHVYLIFTDMDLAPGNAGSILLTDIFIPAVFWIGFFLWKSKKR